MVTQIFFPDPRRERGRDGIGLFHQAAARVVFHPSRRRSTARRSTCAYTGQPAGVETLLPPPSSGLAWKRRGHVSTPGPAPLSFPFGCYDDKPRGCCLVGLACAKNLPKNDFFFHRASDSAFALDARSPLGSYPRPPRSRMNTKRVNVAHP